MTEAEEARALDRIFLLEQKLQRVKEHLDRWARNEEASSTKISARRALEKLWVQMSNEIKTLLGDQT